MRLSGFSLRPTRGCIPHGITGISSSTSPHTYCGIPERLCVPRAMPRPGDQRGPPRPADRPASHAPKHLPALDRFAGNLVSGKGPFPQNREDAMPDLASVLEQACVPEHSAPFMQAMSQGTAFLEGEYLFLTADDWLMAIGYPLSGEYAHETFERALAAACGVSPNGSKAWTAGPSARTCPSASRGMSRTGTRSTSCRATRRARPPAPPGGNRR